MSLPLILACIWALVATGTAMLPMRYQPWPGIPLLVAAPVLLVWIGREHGTWWAVAGLLGFLSMFRYPLIFLVRRALGLPVSRPPGLAESDLSPAMRRMLPREARDAEDEGPAERAGS
ncbi:DUF2484 family protein [Frigidibacter sp. ROC022]|uniref:DUF2484 family protein n=1 Tax=Frigidibacter sp. ROC022 TaxID=2971796 RepID=UPI00215AA56B|nr:DUF2484 family protein [Frigidibacter sp. ROC022]MCR8725230.1 DUF2484 family protein [Frigidibacter sp. ROC022]